MAERRGSLQQEEILNQILYLSLIYFKKNSIQTSSPISEKKFG